MNNRTIGGKFLVGLLFLVAGACSSSKNTLADGGNATVPTVASVSPSDGALNVSLNGSVNVTFNEAMDPSTLNMNTFTVTSGAPANAVSGTIIYANSVVNFWPAAHFAANTLFTATVTTGAKSAWGIALAQKHTWAFTTGTTLAAGLPVNLSTAGNFVILAKSGISTVPTSAITGNIAVSPAAAGSITGFSLQADASKVFSSSTQVTGKVYAANYSSSTPDNLTSAVGDMQLAFTDAAGRAPDLIELGEGNIGGKTLAAGVYKWSSGLLIPTALTLSGSATDVWIFQVAQNLTMSSATQIYLAGGALPKNIFWQVSGYVEIGTTAHFEGNILSQTSISLRTGASINGRLLAQTAVTLDSNIVNQPSP